MKTQRLDQLSDGIFAIIMTLIALELHTPQVADTTDATALFDAIKNMGPAFGSFVLSFALLFTYWRAHHFLTSVYAKNLTAGFANYNALFFLFIALVPFSAKILGEYSQNTIGVFVYGVNVIAIGLTLYFMRRHIEKNPTIDTTPITKTEYRSGYIRILFPVLIAFIGILVSFANTTLSIVLFSISILFNIVPASSNFIHGWLDKMFSDDDEIVESNYIDPEKGSESRS